MGGHAGIARTGEGLAEGLDKILALRERADRMHVGGTLLYNPGWHACRDVRFMLTQCEAILRAAIERKESRGAHWRLDFPDQDPEWGRKNIIVKRTDAGMAVATSPMPPMPPSSRGCSSRARCAPRGPRRIHRLPAGPGGGRMGPGSGRWTMDDGGGDGRSHVSRVSR